PDVRNILLSVFAQFRDINLSTDPYKVLWASRSISMRVLEGRRHFLRDVSDATTASKVRELLALRHRLACLLLSPSDGKGEGSARLKLFQDLNQDKEDLEKELAGKVHALALQRARQVASP